jgi:hypothetical protein
LCKPVNQDEDVEEELDIDEEDAFVFSDLDDFLDQTSFYPSRISRPVEEGQTKAVSRYLPRSTGENDSISLDHSQFIPKYPCEWSS